MNQAQVGNAAVPQSSAPFSEPIERRLTAAHYETQTDLPHPLSPIAKLDLGVSSIPAVAFSVLSMITLLVTYLILQGSVESRSLLSLPFSPIILAILAWGLTVPILLECSSRPGSLVPRIWSFVVFSALSAACLLFFFYGQLRSLPWFHALSWSLSMSVLMLLPRLARVRSYSALLQLFPIAAFIFLLAAVVPLSCAAGNVSIRSAQREIDSELASIEEWTARIRAIEGYNWRHMASDVHGASARIEELRSLSLSSLRTNDLDFWMMAKSLSRTEDLADAWRRLVDTVVRGYDPAISPRLALQDEAIIRFDRDNVNWNNGLDLKILSQLVDNYYWHMKRLFEEARVEDLGMDGRSSLIEYYRLREHALKEHVLDISRSWSDYWIVARLPGVENWVERKPPSLGRLLEAAFCGNFDLNKCAVRAFSAELADPARYSELGHCSLAESGSLRSVDCFSYEPSSNGIGAHVRLGIHLRYLESASSRLIMTEGQPIVEAVLFVQAPERLARIEDQVRKALDLRGGTVGGFTAQPSQALEGESSEKNTVQIRFTLSLERPGSSDRLVAKLRDN